MRKFTKSLMALAMFCVAGTASAQDVETELTADMFKTWNGYGADAVATGTATVEFKIGTDETLSGGNVVCGTGAVDYLTYADISGSSKLIITGDEGLLLRVLMNRQESNSGPLVEKQATIGDGGSVEVDLTDLTYVHINAIKLGYNGKSGKISSIKYVKPTDPYEVPKAVLKKSLDKAKLQNSFAKTIASWNDLQDAITAGEAEYANPTSTEALTDAATAIDNALAALKLQDGYTNLTKDMYKKWDSATKPTEGTDASGSCAYVLNASTGQPYGDGSVKWYHYADISDFGSLTILAPAGTPRIMMNREEGSPDGGDYVEIKDAPVDGKVTVDLTAYDYAHMNAIKGANWANVTVTDMLLYRTITVGDAGYATFGSLSKNAKPNNVKAYAATRNGSKVTLTEVTNVPAGKGVVIEAAAGSYAPTFDVSADDIESDLLVSNGTVVGDGTIYVLANGDNGVGFYKLANGEKVPAGKGYLTIGSGAAPEFLGFGGDATGINEVKAVEVKGEFFNLAGQRVAKPAKGLYIANGKKVIIK